MDFDVDWVRPILRPLVKDHVSLDFLVDISPNTEKACMILKLLKRRGEHHRGVRRRTLMCGEVKSMPWTSNSNTSIFDGIYAIFCQKTLIQQV